MNTLKQLVNALGAAEEAAQVAWRAYGRQETSWDSYCQSCAASTAAQEALTAFVARQRYVPFDPAEAPRQQVAASAARATFRLRRG